MSEKYQEVAVSFPDDPVQVSVCHKYEGERKDSIEIGTAGKGGAVKVYLDVSDLTGSRQRIDDAVSLLIYMREKHRETGGAIQ